MDVGEDNGSIEVTNPSVIEDILFGTSNWTIEFFLNVYGFIPDRMKTSYMFLGMVPIFYDTRAVYLEYGTSSGMSNRLYKAAQTNSWHHIAAVNYNNTVALYVDGERSSSVVSWNKMIPQGNGMHIGYLIGAQYKLDELRISNVARYTESYFIPPTAPF